jgi:hypothetical protein
MINVIIIRRVLLTYIVYFYFKIDYVEDRRKGKKSQDLLDFSRKNKKSKGFLDALSNFSIYRI